MKFTITIKDPDGFSNSVKQAVQDDVARIEGLDDDEREDLIESRQEKLWDELQQFVEYQEVIRVEFDTETGTATVLKTR
jgi:hypothetical protein